MVLAGICRTSNQVRQCDVLKWNSLRLRKLKGDSGEQDVLRDALWDRGRGRSKHVFPFVTSVLTGSGFSIELRAGTALRLLRGGG